MATTKGVDKVNSSSQEPSQSEESEIGLPPQLHAGKVGLGPNYHPDPTIQEKISGLKEKFKGKIKHDPELVRHGQSILSGEEKRKKLTGDDEPNPFQTPGKSSESSGPSSPSRVDDTGTQKNDSPVLENNVAFEGTKDADIQEGGDLVKGGENTEE